MTCFQLTVLLFESKTNVDGSPCLMFDSSSSRSLSLHYGTSDFFLSFISIIVITDHRGGQQGELCWVRYVQPEVPCSTEGPESTDR